ncbi:MAG: hypothetical protein JSW11_17275 [Candidatus Heimdallarchaeota archaeon]|nr:MAG: hypothetical protein JSW11_17275 [Candidatus Heimdallarchaeota archaeon]
METFRARIDIGEWRRRRGVTESKRMELQLKNRNWIKQKLASEQRSPVSQSDVTQTIEWLKKVSNFVPIPSDKELEEIVRIMVLLSHERAKFPQLFTDSGLKLMKSVREGMIRNMVVLSELRARKKEFLEHWFTDEYWISEWSRVLLDLSPDENMARYDFDDVKAKDFIFLLELELATADTASGLENPMICIQAIENKDSFLIIPTEAAAKEYKSQVDKIIKNKITFTQWMKETLEYLGLPK